MRIEVDGAQLFFEVVGAKLAPEGREMREKPTLLVLHGGPGADHSIHRPAFDQLADIAQVVYLDHRGQGRSDRGSPEVWHLDRWADDVRGFCDTLGIEAPIVLGHSFGGMVAMAYAVRHPGHAGRLVFSGTYARKDLARSLDCFERRGGPEAREAAREFWTKPCAETSVEYAKLAMRWYTRDEPTEIDAGFRVVPSPEVGFHFLGGEGNTFDLLPGLARVRCPTLVIGGALDPVCPIEDSRDIAAALPAELTTLVELADSSHMFWIDAPEALFASLREFIAADGAH